MNRKLHYQLHKCMLSTRKGERCKNGILLAPNGNHVVIEYQGVWSELCRRHFQEIFRFIITTGPVATNEADCILEEV